MHMRLPNRGQGDEIPLQGVGQSPTVFGGIGGKAPKVFSLSVFSPYTSIMIGKIIGLRLVFCQM